MHQYIPCDRPREGNDLRLDGGMEKVNCTPSRIKVGDMFIENPASEEWFEESRNDVVCSSVSRISRDTIPQRLQVHPQHLNICHVEEEIRFNPAGSVSFEDLRDDVASSSISRISRAPIRRRFNLRHQHDSIYHELEFHNEQLSTVFRLDTCEEGVEEKSMANHKSGLAEPLLDSQYVSLVDKSIAISSRTRKPRQLFSVSLGSSVQWRLVPWSKMHQNRYRIFPCESEGDVYDQSKNIHRSDREHRFDRNIIGSCGRQLTSEEGTDFDIAYKSLSDDSISSLVRKRAAFGAYDNRLIVENQVEADGRDESFHRERWIDEPLLNFYATKPSVENAREKRNRSPSSSAGRTDNTIRQSTEECDERDQPPRVVGPLQTSSMYNSTRRWPTDMRSPFKNRTTIPGFVTINGPDGNQETSNEGITATKSATHDLSAFSNGGDSESTMDNGDERPLVAFRSVVCNCRSTKCRKKSSTSQSNTRTHVYTSAPEMNLRNVFPRKYESLEESSELHSIRTMRGPAQRKASGILVDGGERVEELDELDSLIKKIDQMGCLSTPVDSHISAIAEGDEGLTQQKSSISIKTENVSSNSKTKKLAQYLKRDGEATFDYVGTMYLIANSMESSTHETEQKEEGMAFFAHLETRTSSAALAKKDESTREDGQRASCSDHLNSAKKELTDDGPEDVIVHQYDNDADGGRENRRNRIVVLKDDEIILPTPSEASSVDLSDITEDFLQISMSSPLFKKAAQMYKEAKREAAESKARTERGSAQTFRHVLSVDTEHECNDLKIIVALPL